MAKRRRRLLSAGSALVVVLFVCSVGSGPVLAHEWKEPVSKAAPASAEDFVEVQSEAASKTSEPFTMAIMNAITYLPLFAFMQFAEWYDNREYRKVEKQVNKTILEARNKQCSLLLSLRMHAQMQSSVEMNRIAVLQDALQPAVKANRGKDVKVALDIIRYFIERSSMYMSEEITRAGCADLSADILESEAKVKEYVASAQAHLENDHTIPSQIVDITIRFGIDMGTDKMMEHLAMLVPGMAAPGTAGHTTALAAALAPTFVVVGNLLNYAVVVARLYKFAVDSVEFWDHMSLLRPREQMVVNDLQYATCLIYAGFRMQGEKHTSNSDLATRVSDIQRANPSPLEEGVVTSEFLVDLRRRDGKAAIVGICEFLDSVSPIRGKSGGVSLNWSFLEAAMAEDRDTFERVRAMCRREQAPGRASSVDTEDSVSTASGGDEDDEFRLDGASADGDGTGQDDEDDGGSAALLTTVVGALKGRVNMGFVGECTNILQTKGGDEPQDDAEDSEADPAGPFMAETLALASRGDRRYPITDVVVVHEDEFVDRALKKAGYEVIDRRYPFLNMRATSRELEGSGGRCAQDACLGLPGVSRSLMMQHCGARVSTALYPLHCREDGEGDVPPQPIMYVKREPGKAPVTSVAAWGVVDTEVKTKEKHIEISQFGRLLRLAEADYEFVGLPCSVLKAAYEESKAGEFSKRARHEVWYNKACTIEGVLYPNGDDDHIIRTNVNLGCSRSRDRPVHILAQRSTHAPLDDIAVTNDIGCSWGSPSLHVVDTILTRPAKDGSIFFRDTEELIQPKSNFGARLHLWNKKTYEIFEEDVMQREVYTHLDEQLAIFSEAPIKLRYRCNKAMTYMDMAKSHPNVCGESLGRMVSVGTGERYAFAAVKVPRPRMWSAVCPRCYGKLYVFWGLLAWREVRFGRDWVKKVIPFEDILSVGTSGLNSISISYRQSGKEKRLDIGGLALRGKYRRKDTLDYVQAMLQLYEAEQAKGGS